MTETKWVGYDMIVSALEGNDRALNYLHSQNKSGRSGNSSTTFRRKSGRLRAGDLYSVT